MDKTTTLLIALTAMVPSACLNSEGRARVRRITDSDSAPALLASGKVQTVRSSYGSGYLLPPRSEPYYFCDAQRSGVAALPPAAKGDYEHFCRQSTYPHTLDTWENLAVLTAQGKRRVLIRLADQRGLLLVDGRPALDFPVCTGSSSRPTPTGSFEVLEKDPDHHSNLYDNAPMHCFMRMTWDGVGMHIGPMAGAPASHGCIRLPEPAARRLYSIVSVGTPVHVLP